MLETNKKILLFNLGEDLQKVLLFNFGEDLSYFVILRYK